MRTSSPEDDIKVSGEFQITVGYSFECDKSLTLSEKLELMEIEENRILKEIEKIDNIYKTKI